METGAFAVLAGLDAAGVLVTAIDGRLSLRPASRVPVWCLFDAARHLADLLHLVTRGAASPSLSPLVVISLEKEGQAWRVDLEAVAPADLAGRAGLVMVTTPDPDDHPGEEVM